MTEDQLHLKLHNEMVNRMNEVASEGGSMWDAIDKELENLND